MISHSFYKEIIYRFTLSLGFFPAFVACALMISGCAGAQKEVDKAFEISDDLGRERRTKVLGQDVIVHPEADKKITIPF